MNKKIVKRDGSLEDFNSEKIFKALKKAFQSTNITFKDEEVRDLANKVVEITNNESTSVEEIQDLVEETLMKNGYYDVARHYIIYREERSKKRQYRYTISNLVPSYNLYRVLKDIQKEYDSEAYNLSKLLAKYQTYLTFKMSENEKMHCLIRAAISLISLDAPCWDNIAGRLFMVNFNVELKENLKQYNLNTFIDRLKLFVHRFRYDPSLLTYYTEDELKEAEKFINRYRDKLLTFNNIKFFIDDYLIRLDELNFVESIQDLYLVLALIIAKESSLRLEEVERIYNLLSKQELSINSSLVSVALKSIRL